MSSSPRKALSWSFARNMSSLGLNAVLGFLLAAILGPESFGIVAIAGIFIFFLGIIGGQFFIPVIIQRDNLTKGHQDTIFWINVVWCLAMVIVAYFLSGYWGEVNNSPEVADVIVALAPLVLVKGLVIVPSAMLLRTMDFKHLTYLIVISATSGGIVGIYMAFNGYGVWALVFQQWIAALVHLCLTWLFSPYILGFTLSWTYLKEVLPFARGAFLNEMGGFTQSRVEAILVGILFGPILIALYRICDKMVQIITSLLSRSINAFILPYASQHQNDTKKLTQIVEKCIRLSTGLSFPVLGVLGGTSIVVLEVLGDEWKVAWLGLSMLCVVGAVQSFSLLTPHLLQAVGKPGIGAALTWGTAFTSVASFVFVAGFVQDEAIEYQLAALTGARAMVFLAINVPANLLLINWIVNFPPGHILRLLVAPLSSFIMALLSGYFLLNLIIPEIWNVYFRLALSGAGSGLIAIATLFLLDNYAFRIFLDLLKAVNKRLFLKWL
jgi:polysaccharide transporter, PST family